MSDPDRDAGTENAYENRPFQSDLCERCGENAALPDEDWCESCTTEHELAFDVADPKHPRHYDVMADLWDNREKVA